MPLEKGAITDDTRIRASLPTLEHLLKGGARLVLASHLGRPKKGPSPDLSLKPVAERLSQLVGQARAPGPRLRRPGGEGHGATRSPSAA